MWEVQNPFAIITMGEIIPIVIFDFLIDLAVINSFILWQVNKRKRSLNQLTFSSSANRRIFLKKKKRSRSASFQVKKSVVPDDVRIASVGKTFSSYRVCRKCCRKEQEKRIRCLCAECDIPLCFSTCFLLFRAKKKHH
ncbi:hypothetical protein TNCV_731801 [Trichonephila clavipes]|nr:hypothetical protein TNCV_731801 [Trichonephila clavipes]